MNSIRKPTISECWAILKLHNREMKYYEFYFWFLLSFFPKGEILICTNKSEISGYIASFRNRITEIFVSEKFRHQGVGQSLLNKSFTNRYKKIIVYTSNKNNAITFYKKVGFVTVKLGKITKLEKIN